MAPLAVPRASVLRVRLDAQDGVQFFRCEPQQVLQVAYEAVHVALPCRLVDDVLVVVIAQTAAQLLIVHLGLVLPLSPPAGHLIGVSKLKLPSVPSPADERLAGFVREQFQEKLPQLDRSTSWGEGALHVFTDFKCGKGSVILMKQTGVRM